MSTEQTRTVAVGVGTIYYAGRRRFLTKRAAYESLARQLILTRCDCSPRDPVAGGGETCRYHDGDHFPVLLKRLTRWIRRQGNV